MADRKQPPTKSSYSNTPLIQRQSSFGGRRSREGNVAGGKSKIDQPHSVQLLIDRGYEVLERVGIGNYSTVYRVKSTTKKEMAVKIIEMEKVSKNYKFRFLPRELEIIAKLKHENIIKVYAIQTTHRYCYIFMEFAPNGTLGDFIRRNGAIPEWMAKPIMLQIANALNYLHASGIAHRDVKLENIMLDKFQNPKLTDFSYSLVCLRDPTTGNFAVNKTFCGSLPYMPPEILKKQPYDPKASDVWSLGVCLYIVLNDRVPFRFNDIISMVKSQVSRDWTFKGHVKDATSEECRDLVNRMLDPNQVSRITAAQIIEHSWFTKPSTTPGTCPLPSKPRPPSESGGIGIIPTKSTLPP